MRSTVTEKRDRSYRRRRIKNENVCQYSSQEEVNHRWELSEMGRAKLLKISKTNWKADKICVVSD